MCNLTATCPDPTPLHGRVHKRGQSTQFLSGDEVRFSCDPGYIITQNIRIECTPYRSWSSQPPSCTGNKYC